MDKQEKYWILKVIIALGIVFTGILMVVFADSAGSYLIVGFGLGFLGAIMRNSPK